MQKQIIKNSVKGFLVSMALSVVLLMICGYICYTRQDPASLFKPLGIAVLYISAFAGGFAAARFNKTDGMLAGLFTGIMLMVFIIILSLFLRQNGEGTGIIRWFLYVFVAFICAFGGRLGIPSVKKRRKRSKKR
ncbi:MAG: TIGR04086 family membrane protein [Clostridia bacterium]|nr:TIGR04086 family membrane protein [Clostridia bacterium]